MRRIFRYSCTGEGIDKASFDVARALLGRAVVTARRSDGGLAVKVSEGVAHNDSVWIGSGVVQFASESGARAGPEDMHSVIRPLLEHVCGFRELSAEEAACTALAAVARLWGGEAVARMGIDYAYAFRVEPGRMVDKC